MTAPTVAGRPRKGSRLKLIALGAVVLVLGGLGAGLVLVDQAAIKTRMTDAVFRATGRALVIAGKLSVRPGMALVLAAEEVSLANPPGFSRPEMAHVGRVEARVAWLPLLSGRIEVERLSLRQPSVLLETDREGAGNWRFATPRPAGGAGAAPQAPGLPRTTGRMALRSVELDGGALAWRDGRSGRAGEIPVERLTLVAPDNAPIDIDGIITLGGIRTHLAGQLGSEAALAAATQAAPWPVRLLAENAAGRLSVTGGFADPREGRGYDLAWDGTASDLSLLSSAVGFALPALRDARFEARVAERGGAAPEVSAVRFHVGATDIAAPGLAGLHIDHLDILAPRMDAPVEVSLDGVLAGTAVKLAATIGPLAGASARLPIDARAEAAGSILRITGALARPAKLEGLDLSVVANIADLAALSPLVGKALPHLVSLSVSAKVADRDGGLRQGATMRDIAVASPLGDISGTAGWRFAARPELTADLASRRLDVDGLRAVLAAQKSLPPGPPPPTALPPSAAGPARAIPDTELPLAALNRADADLRVVIAELRVEGMELRDFAAHVLLRNGKLVIDPAGLQGAGGRIDMNASVDASVTEPPLALSMHGNGVAVKPLLAVFGLPDDAAANADVSVDLHGQGRTLRALAGGLDGHVALAMADGEIDNSLLTAVLGSALRAARLPAEFGQGKTSIHCLALRLDATHGRVAATTMLLDTTRLLLQGTGEVNLADEALALRLRPLLRVGGPGVVVPIRVGGTMMQPKAALDSAGMLGSLMTAERRTADVCAPALANARRP